MNRTNNQLKGLDTSLLKLSEHDQALLTDFIHGHLTQSELIDLEKRLIDEPLLATALERQQELERLISVGTSPQISSERMSGVHWSTHKALRREAEKRNWFLLKLSSIWQAQISFKTQFVSILGSLGIGYLIASLSVFPHKSGQENGDELSSNIATLNGTELKSNMLPVNLIKSGDFEITNLSLDNVDSNSGAIKLTYSLTSRTSLGGNIASPEIQGLLTSTISSNVNDSTRLTLVDLLKDHAEINQVRKALSQSLLNDPNPGVRMAAAESLAQFSHSGEVRDILRQALANDINSGIRVEAFQALTKYSQETETQKIFKQFSVNDSNQFIREQARILTNTVKLKTKSNNI